MLPELAPHAHYTPDLAATLDRFAREVEGLRGVQHFEDQYVQWVERTARMLHNDLSRQEAEKALRTPGYWAVVAGARAVTQIVSAEVEGAAARLRLMGEAVRGEAETWNHVNIAVVPDTNCLLHEIDSLANAPWADMAGLVSEAVLTVAVPLKVVDEMDRLKRNKSVKSTARLRIRELATLLGDAKSVNLPQPTGRVRLTFIGNPRDHIPLPDADSEIVDRALSLRQRIRPAGRVILLTADVGMVLRARTVGLDVELQKREDTEAEAAEAGGGVQASGRRAPR